MLPRLRTIAKKLEKLVSVSAVPGSARVCTNDKGLFCMYVLVLYVCCIASAFPRRHQADPVRTDYSNWVRCAGCSLAGEENHARRVGNRGAGWNRDRPDGRNLLPSSTASGMPRESRTFLEQFESLRLLGPQASPGHAGPRGPSVQRPVCCCTDHQMNMYILASAGPQPQCAAIQSHTGSCQPPLITAQADLFGPGSIWGGPMHCPTHCFTNVLDVIEAACEAQVEPGTWCGARQSRSKPDDTYLEQRRTACAPVKRDLMHKHIEQSSGLREGDNQGQPLNVQRGPRIS